MSKIGRKPISFSSAKIELNGNKVVITGPKTKLVHELPEHIKATLKDKSLVLLTTKDSRKARCEWGLHRALLANEIKGLEKGFEQKMKIVGLGYKAQLSGKKMVFSLGYSHKIDYVVPEGVTVEIDKTGQLLTLRAQDKNLLGNVCDDIRNFRLPEPYKGTGIMREEEVIRRKAGKTAAKAAA